jgi:hypothetical protein
MPTDRKLVCSRPRCGWSGPDSEALHAPDPFNKGDELTACPKCREQSLVSACDEPGCNKEAGMGTQTPEGYRWTCYEHRPKDLKARASDADVEPH